MHADELQIAPVLLREVTHQLHEGMQKINHCLKQLDDVQVWRRPTKSQNSIANLMLHLEGNVHQWLISGITGEPDIRDRPREFAETGPIEKAALQTRLSVTVDRAIQVVAVQSAESLLEERRIQGFDTTVAGAIIDSVAHFRGHVQEIISLTRQQLKEQYVFYFVPQSAEQGA